MFWYFAFMAYEILVPPPWIEHTPCCTGRWNLNHWTTRKSRSEVWEWMRPGFPMYTLFILLSVQFSRCVSDSLQPHGLQYARLPCPSPIPGACCNSCPSSWWCHPTISSSVTPFSSCPQSFPSSRSFPMSQFFESSGQRIGVSASASILAMNIQDWFPLGWTGLISLLSKGLSRVFSNTIVQKHQFFGTQISL